MKKSLPLTMLLLLTLTVACIAAPVASVANTATSTAVATSTISPSPTVTPTITSTPIPVGSIARGYIAALSETIGRRVAGTEAERTAEQYIASAFEKIGYQPEVQKFDTTYENEDGYWIAVSSSNVIAVKPGQSKQEIVVGAHYDSVGGAGRGADDNASGVAVMLEVAGRVKDLQTPYTIRFIAFGAEETDLNGSTYYVQQMNQDDIKNTIAMINLDSVTAGDNTYIYSAEGAKAKLRDWTLDWAKQNGLELQTIKNVNLTDEYGYGTSDYYAFQQAGIPFVYFEATNWTLGARDGYTQTDPKFGDHGEIWHTQFDALKYLDATFPGRVDAHLNLYVSTLQAILTEYTQ